MAKHKKAQFYDKSLLRRGIHDDIQPDMFRRSSAVEQLTVNQLAVGSIPTAGAKNINKIKWLRIARAMSYHHRRGSCCTSFAMRTSLATAPKRTAGRSEHPPLNCTASSSQGLHE